MRTAKTYILTIALAFIFIAAGFFLPEWIISYTDQSIIGKVRLETVEPQKTISDNETSIIEKIGLLRNYPQNVNRIALKMGTKFDLTSANDKFFEEISVLTELGLLPEIEPSDKTTIQIGVSLYAKKADPSISGVFWNIDFQKGEFSGNFYMDDNTGKIIQFVVTVPNKPMTTEKNTIEVWAEYLALEVQKIESQPEYYPIWVNVTTKISRDYNVYNFEFKFKDNVLPYAFYTFENGYGFGYITKPISGYYDNYIKIKP